MPPDEIDSMRKVAQTLVDAENAWRTDETPTKWAAVERARQALESYIDAAELLRLLARLAEAEELLIEAERELSLDLGDLDGGAEGFELLQKIRALLGARGKEKV